MAETVKQRLDREQKLKFWRSHIESWSLSTTPASGYCRKHNLSLSQFKYWQQRISKALSPLFIEVETTTFSAYAPPQPERTITLETHVGFTLSIRTTAFDADLTSLLNLTGMVR
jgi:hypothetical protein